jgi:peptide/nickel transport system substrate-binding protein
MFSARTAYWYVQSFWHKYYKMLFLGLVMGVAIVIVFPRLMTLLPQLKRTRYIGRVGLYSWADLPLDIQEKMSVGLTTLNEKGEPIPVLAERWSVEEDGKVFRFLLKDKLSWQDGKPFGPADIDYNFKDVQVIRTDHEIVYRLPDPYAPFATTVIQPLFRQVTRKRFGFFVQHQVIGLGEYRVQSIRYNGGTVGELVLENSSERLVYRFYSSEAAAVTAFRHGSIDMVEGISDISALLPEEKQKYTIVNNVNLRQFVALYFNTADTNLPREVRQALNYAAPKPDASSELLRALTPISPTSWAYNSTNEINPFLYDMAQAITLYTAVNPQQPLQLTIDSALSLLPEAQQIADSWTQLGKATQTRCQQQGTSTTKNKDGTLPKATSCDRFAINVAVRVAREIDNNQVLLIGREAPADPDQYSWWHSTQALNISRYQNPRVDKILEDARRETDQNKRKLLYFDMQKYLVDDVPAVFLYYLPSYTIKRHPNL